MLPRTCCLSRSTTMGCRGWATHGVDGRRSACPGALGAVELVHNGHAVSNRYSRLPVMGVSDLPVAALEPSQAWR
ncbi:MAG: hypothetical protein CM1200mP41_13900 [Gammaproteobacteria bacterium]|nr:MAG: hypothetical protein CM1200mP41_13900 [Gammaproteobacteria bacterium]